MRKIYSSVFVGAALLIASPDISAAGGFGLPALGGLKDAPVSYKDAPVISRGTARFYLRGDTGYSIGSDPDGYEGRDYLAYESLDGAWTIGGGIGMYLTPALRADLTIDHRFSADLEGHNPVNNGQDNRTELESTVYLANFYWDLADRSNTIVPYVGIGLGLARNKTGTRTMSACTDSNGCTTPAGKTGGASKTSFAGAAMLGFTKNFGEAWKIDTGYRYLYMGEARTGAVDPAVGDPLTFDELSAHEFRVGVRYDLYR